MAHAGGFFGGLFLGVVVLKNFRVYRFERVLFWLSLVVFVLLIVVGIVVNVTNVNCQSVCTQNYDPLSEYIEDVWNMYKRN